MISFPSGTVGIAHLFLTYLIENKHRIGTHFDTQYFLNKRKIECDTINNCIKNQFIIVKL